MTQGICRNAACPNAANAVPVDRYPGPGEYCPECGAELEELPAAEPRPEPQASASAPAPEPEAPFGGLTPLQALQQMEPPPAASPAAPRRRRSAKPFVFASLAVAVVVGGGFVALHPSAIGRPSSDGLHVCRSSISERFSTDVVAGYRTKSADRAAQPIAYLSGDCDVRFSVVSGSDPGTATIVARDALVAVVNPENPVTRLTLNELRGILSGELTDWSQVGTGHGPIAIVVPDESTDEGRLVLKEILGTARLGSKVKRVASTADVVSRVAGAHGRNVLGIAAFSGAVPAKVLRLGAAPPPSLLSIADRRYPLAVAIGVETAGAAPPPEATTLVRYARSEEAQAIAARDGLVPLKGY